MKTASVSANRRQKSLLLPIVLGLFLLPIIIFVGLTIVDSLNPERSYRLLLLNRLGLTSRAITETFSPKVISLPPWEASDFYWHPRDQETLNTEAGPRCAVIGELVESSPEWKVKSKQGQIYEVSMNDYLNIPFLVRNPFFDEETDQWAEGNRIARMADFEQGNVVLVEWDCPIENPEKMVEGNEVKEEFLVVKKPL